MVESGLGAELSLCHSLRRMRCRGIDRELMKSNRVMM